MKNEEEDNMDNDFQIAQWPAQLVLSVRTRAAVQDLPRELGRVY